MNQKSDIHPSMQRVYEVTKKGQSAIARAINASPQNVKNWEDRGISKKGLQAIQERFGLSTDWILTGNGSPYKDKQKPSIDDLKRQIDTLRQADIKVIETENLGEIVQDVPVISWVAAGSWTGIEPKTIEDAIDYLPRPKRLSKMGFALIVKGRSMYPEFKPNDVIFVEPMVDVFALNDGDLVVVSCNDDSEATFKQLVVGETSDDMYLKPLNPEWHEQRMQPIGECRLVGKVVGKYTDY